ncbi:MAG TPA: hypothetical protein VD926_02815, partial [Acidimicrobiales bacterium]|nr:hypothetical protein [Acidimicrobiales bacterium]
MRRGLVTVALVLGGLVVPLPAAPAQETEGSRPAPPSLAVWPRSNLVDGQELRIALRDWPDRSWLAAWTCHADDNAYRWDSRCDLLGELDPGPRGGARIRRLADVIIDGPEPVDCRVEPCEVQVMDPNMSEDPGQILLRVPVTFDPTGPDPVRPTTEATPTTGLRTGDVVEITGTGYPLRVNSPQEAAVEPREHPEIEGDDGPARP